MGLLTGGAISAPVAVFVTKRVCDKKMAEEVAKASEEGENRGMDAMASYAISQQQEEKKLTEEDYGVKEIPDEEDINNYDVTIDDEEATEEAQARAEAHERYLDMIDKYNGNARIPPYIIDADKFTNEQYMEKSYVNWYEEDNVFEEDLRTIDDPYMTFGVTDGAELFKDSQNRPDPDICYVRNERYTTDFEISRIHGSYAKIVEAKESLGQTDS